MLRIGTLIFIIIHPWMAPAAVDCPPPASPQSSSPQRAPKVRIWPAASSRPWPAPSCGLDTATARASASPRWPGPAPRSRPGVGVSSGHRQPPTRRGGGRVHQPPPPPPPCLLRARTRPELLRCSHGALPGGGAAQRVPGPLPQRGPGAALRAGQTGVGEAASPRAQRPLSWGPSPARPAPRPSPWAGPLPPRPPASAPATCPSHPARSSSSPFPRPDHTRQLCGQTAGGS